MSEQEKFASTLDVAALTVLSLARSFFDAFVMWKMWGWFFVPAGLHPIGYWVAYGIDVSLMMVVLAGWRGDLVSRKMTREQSLSNIWACGFGYAIVLVVGFAAHIAAVTA